MNDAPNGWGYVFNGTSDSSDSSDSRLSFPGGAFSSREKAEAWIEGHKLSGILTAYPLDEGVWDWTVERGFFKPKRDDQRMPASIGRFSSAYTGHWPDEHGLDGERSEAP